MTGIQRVCLSSISCGRHHSPSWPTDGLAFVDWFVVTIVVVAVWALTIAGGANICLGTGGHSTHRDETGGHPKGAIGSHSICLPCSADCLSHTDAWKLADKTSTGKMAVGFRDP